MTRDFEGVVDGGGYKTSMDDARKLPVHLVPGALVRATARGLQHGARKYAPNNWRRGMPFTGVLSAMERHLLALKDGEMMDSESGLHHLDHIACNVAFLTEFLERPEYARFNDLLLRASTPPKETNRSDFSWTSSNDLLPCSNPRIVCTRCEERRILVCECLGGPQAE